MKLCLALIEVRQQNYEKQREEAIAQRQWSTAGGLHCIEAGLLMAANILREKMQGPPPADVAAARQLMKDCLASVEQHQRTYDVLRDAAVKNQQWNEAGMMDATGSGLLVASIVLREDMP